MGIGNESVVFMRHFHDPIKSPHTFLGQTIPEIMILDQDLNVLGYHSYIKRRGLQFVNGFNGDNVHPLLDIPGRMNEALRELIPLRVPRRFRVRHILTKGSFKLFIIAPRPNAESVLHKGPLIVSRTRKPNPSHRSHRWFGCSWVCHLSYRSHGRRRPSSRSS